MKRLEQLPEITDRALGGLNAGEAMKQRILAEARQGSRTAPVRRRWMPAACASLALVVALAVGIPTLQQQLNEQPLINTMSLGEDDHIGNEGVTASLNNNSVSINSKNGVPAFRTLWEQTSGGSFPLIGLDGRYYRMMTSPASVSPSLLGGCIGTVQAFTTEPALTSSGVLMSNKAPSGTEVYEILGMGGTLLAAKIDGSYRLFQRVSFNGNALRGTERLQDTLQIAGHIAMMELSGVGVIDDHAVCEQLFATLCSYADFASSGSITSQQSLLIELDNGLTVQLMVKNDKLGACGVWSCPEFFEGFAAAVQ